MLHALLSNGPDADNMTYPLMPRTVLLRKPRTYMGLLVKADKYCRELRRQEPQAYTLASAAKG